jgi:hypothetical protein
MHAETRLGQNGVAFAFAVPLGVGTEFEKQAHIYRLSLW